MRKFIKILVTSIIFIFLVCAIALSLLIYFMDPNSLKPIIIEEVVKKTGYKLVIDGQLTWTLYPHIGIKIPHVTLTEPNQTHPFIELTSIKMATSFTSILHAKKQLLGDLQINAINFMNLKLHDADVGIHWQNNTITLKPIHAKLYEGNLIGEAAAKNFMNTPQWSWQVNIANVQIRSLLSDLSQKQSLLQLSGLAQLAMTGNSLGKSKDALMANLSGKLDFTMQQGMLEGINLDYVVATADAIINKRKLSLPDNIKQTQFEQLTAAATITNGVVKTNNILLQSQTLTTQGQAIINLPAQTIDAKLSVKPKKQIETQYEIPVTITGSLTTPNINADMHEIENRVAKEVIDRLKNKVEDKITKFLGR